MIIECTNCHARYQYEPARFEGKASKKIRCAKCHEVFEITNPEAAPSRDVPAPAPAPAPPAPSSAADHDMTMSRRKSFSGTAADSPVVDELVAPRPRPTLGLPADRRYSLAITDGEDAAKVFRIEKPRVTIGRSGTDVALNDAEASREHAAIEIHGNVVYLEDLGSTNGTLVNGKKIGEPVEIANQQEFTVGMTTLMLIITAAE
ncbi:MAG: FHA domain-containing protein [Thermoanaerobaculia bacterium]